MTGNGATEEKKWLPHDAELAAALASGKSNREAAEASGLTLRTVNRRMARPWFRTVVNDARTAYLDRALAALMSAAPSMVDVLTEVANDKRAPASVRVRAASSVLAHAQRLREHVDLAERLTALENGARGTGHGRPTWAN